MTLPRFRLPDESSSQNVPSVISANLEALDFDELDQMKTRMLARNPNANMGDIVDELHAAASGRPSPFEPERELTSDDLLDDVPDADDVQEVDVSELVFDRVVARRDVWYVHRAVHPPKASISGPQRVRQRFIITALAAMFAGALLAIGLALIVWHFSGLSP